MAKIVSHADWLKARTALLAEEKAFTKARDALSEKTRALPWRKIDKDYAFETSEGRQSLADLFAGHSQLITYHFMYGPDWTVGCKSCSLLVDHFDRLSEHLGARDVSLVAVSRGPLANLQAFKARMGWTFRWVSSEPSDFNFDFQVSATAAELAQKETTYNFKKGPTFADEMPGISVFSKEGDATVYHTYSAYGRGLEDYMGVYRLLDIVPKGRNETGLSYPMEWVRHRDRYGVDG